MAAVTICSDFGAQEKSLLLFPMFPHLFAMKPWNRMPRHGCIFGWNSLCHSVCYKGVTESTAWPRQLWAHVDWVICQLIWKQGEASINLGGKAVQRCLRRRMNTPPPPLRVSKQPCPGSGGQPGRGPLATAGVPPTWCQAEGQGAVAQAWALPALQAPANLSQRMAS